MERKTKSGVVCDSVADVFIVDEIEQVSVSADGQRLLVISKPKLRSKRTLFLFKNDGEKIKELGILEIGSHFKAVDFILDTNDAVLLISEGVIKYYRIESSLCSNSVEFRCSQSFGISSKVIEARIGRQFAWTLCMNGELGAFPVKAAELSTEYRRVKFSDAAMQVFSLQTNASGDMALGVTADQRFMKFSFPSMVGTEIEASFTFNTFFSSNRLLRLDTFNSEIRDLESDEVVMSLNTNDEEVEIIITPNDQVVLLSKNSAKLISISNSEQSNFLIEARPTHVCASKDHIFLMDGRIEKRFLSKFDTRKPIKDIEVLDIDYLQFENILGIKWHQKYHAHVIMYVKTNAHDNLQIVSQVLNQSDDSSANNSSIELHEFASLQELKDSGLLIHMRDLEEDFDNQRTILINKRTGRISELLVGKLSFVRQFGENHLVDGKMIPCSIFDQTSIISGAHHFSFLLEVHQFPQTSFLKPCPGDTDENNRPVSGLSSDRTFLAYQFNTSLHLFSTLPYKERATLTLEHESRFVSFLRGNGVLVSFSKDIEFICSVIDQGQEPAVVTCVKRNSFVACGIQKHPHPTWFCRNGVTFLLFVDYQRLFVMNMDELSLQVVYENGWFDDFCVKCAYTSPNGESLVLTDEEDKIVLLKLKN